VTDGVMCVCDGQADEQVAGGAGVRKEYMAVYPLEDLIFVLVIVMTNSFVSPHRWLAALACADEEIAAYCRRAWRWATSVSNLPDATLDRTTGGRRRWRTRTSTWRRTRQRGWPSLTWTPATSPQKSRPWSPPRFGALGFGNDECHSMRMHRCNADWLGIPARELMAMCAHSLPWEP